MFENSDRLYALPRSRELMCGWLLSSLPQADDPGKFKYSRLRQQDPWPRRLPGRLPGRLSGQAGVANGTA